MIYLADVFVRIISAELIGRHPAKSGIGPIEFGVIRFFVIQLFFGHTGVLYNIGLKYFFALKQRIKIE